MASQSCHTTGQLSLTDARCALGIEIEQATEARRRTNYEDAVTIALKHIRTYLLVCGLVVVSQPLQGLAQQNSDAAKTGSQQADIERDGQDDFDFEIGTVVDCF
jgi:hypothetical protein